MYFEFVLASLCIAPHLRRGQLRRAATPVATTSPPARTEKLLQSLSANAAAWRAMPGAERAAVARECCAMFASIDPGWLRDSMALEGSTESVDASKKHYLFVSALHGSLLSIARTLERDDEAQGDAATRADGSVVHSFPTPLPTLPGVTGEIWCSKTGVPAAASPGDGCSGAEVCLVLGAGNTDFLGLRDCVQRLFCHGECVLLKHHPLRPFLSAPAAHIFAPLVARGCFAQIMDPGDVAQIQGMVQHPLVGHVAVTGGAVTHLAVAAAQRAVGRQDSLSSELGCVTPWIFIPDEPSAETPGWNDASVSFAARNLAAVKLDNGGHNCNSPQVVILPSGWGHTDAFLAALRGALSELPAIPPYYPGSFQRADEAARAAEACSGASVERIPTSAGHDFALVALGEAPAADAALAPWVRERGAVLREEAFGPLLVVLSLPSASPTSYMDASARLCNEHIFGSLSCVLLVPSTIAQEQLDRGLVAPLQYGAVAVNLWSAFNYLFPEGTWGAFPGRFSPAAPSTEADGVGSGNGVVGNALALDGVQKSVLRAELASPVTDMSGRPPARVFSALAAGVTHSHRKGSRGSAYAVVAALAALVTGGPAAKAGSGPS